MQRDQAIRDQLESEIFWDPSIDERNLLLRVEDGVVTLSGESPDAEQSLAVEDLAMRIIGVRGVINEIHVPSPANRSDDDISRSAKNALQWLLSDATSQIRVEVIQGWVTLAGRVKYWPQRSAAENAVRALAGVRGVTNRLNLAPPGPSHVLSSHFAQVPL